ncbi:hypothetical protein Q5752_004984 [Cryptotrichosporon argae]
MMALPPPPPHSFEFVPPAHASLLASPTASGSGSVSAHAELPPPLPHPTFPFPITHTRSSPYPMTQSFSALGTAAEPSTRGPSPLAAAPPATPRPLAMPLPGDAGVPAANASTPTTIPAPQPVAAPAPPVLPPTPDPSPPTNKLPFPLPVAMVALAPPADEPVMPPLAPASTTPRRLPAIAIDTNVPPTFVSTDSASSASSGDKPRPARAKVSRSDSQPMLSNRSSSGGRSKSGGRPRPRRTQTMQPSHAPAGPGPSSVGMMPTRSADARNRIRGGKMVRHHTFVAGPSGAYTSPQSSPGIARAYTESTTPTPTPPRSQLTPEPADLGGPDGLEAKVVLLGSQGVGKTSLILRYTSRTFSPTPASATIGNSLYTRKLVHEGTRVKLQIWDTAGQERFRSMAPIYYRGAHVCVLVYDISDRRSFDDVKSWLDELGRTVPKETVIYVVGAKVDLGKQRAVELDEASRVLRSWLKPPPPTPPTTLAPPQRSIFRSTSGRARPDSLVSPAPTRSHSFHALAYVEGSPSVGPSAPAAVIAPAARPPRSPRKPSVAERAVADKAGKPERTMPRPILQTPSNSTTIPFPALTITSPTSAMSPTASKAVMSANRVSFPALQSPGPATAAVTMPSEPVSPTLSSSATLSGHATSAGRFSMSGLSGVLGLGTGVHRSTSVSGAASNLAQLAQLAISSTHQPAPRRRPQSMALPAPTPRVRTESSPLAPPAAFAESALSSAGGRRRSEDWSARWRPDGDDFAALRTRGSGDRLERERPERTEWAEWPGDVPATASAAFVSFGAAAAQVGYARRSRNRGGSLGRDSRLYGPEPGRDERADVHAGWGRDVEGVRIGECSALTGEGVEQLFRSISSVLVGRKDKIERERTLRHKHSVVLADTPAEAAPTKRGGCC